VVVRLLTRTFYPGPSVAVRRSGQHFAKLHPGKSPYWAFGWSSMDGPRLGPGLLVGAVHNYLDALQAEVLDVAARPRPIRHSTRTIAVARGSRRTGSVVAALTRLNGDAHPAVMLRRSRTHLDGEPSISGG
jgi:hypothetical protein